MNNKDKLRFAFVSNSMEIAAIVKALINPEQEYLEVHEASMEEAVPLAEDLLQQGVEVIIGGGATGKLLRQRSHLPVACISRTAIDILRALMKARGYGTKIGLSSYESPETGIDLLEELLNISIRHFTFSSTQGLIENIALAKENAIHCMVGSAIMGKIARSMGLESVVVYPGKDVILHTLESARTLAVAKRNERRKGERMRIILESVSEGVIGVDLQGRVNVYNDSAARYFDINQEDILGRLLPDILRGTGINQVLQSGEPDIDQVRRISSKDMFINTLPVMVNGRQEAVISTFKPISRIQNIDKKIIREHLARGFVARYTLDHLKGTSPAMAELRHKADKYARTDASIMIIGETGTGKEILAQAIHNASAFKNMPFVAVNCSALPESLLESELFGYEEGAFTGAKRGGKTGLFEIANQGTIFLDEIADIPKSLQVRLLRVLEEKEIMRLGGDRIISVDVRIISSSHRDLAVKMNNQDFRNDLYFRLAVLRLQIPPLRARLNDIPEIVSELLRKHGLSKDILTSNMLDKLKCYFWPGNIRELDGLLRRYAVLLDRDKPDYPLFESLFKEARSTRDPENRAGLPDCDQNENDLLSLRQQVKIFEKSVIHRALQKHSHSRTSAARSLGISVNSLWRKTKE